MTIERPFTQMTEQEKLEWTFREKLVKQKRQPNTTVEEYGHDNGSRSIVGKQDQMLGPVEQYKL